MPANFGQVKKASIERDVNSFSGKNLNLYVISLDDGGKFISTNLTIKQIKDYLQLAKERNSFRLD